MNTVEQTPEELREALARINPGDDVTVLMEWGGHEAIVSTGDEPHQKVWKDKHGWLRVGPSLLSSHDDLSSTLRAVLSHTPAVPPQPEGEHALQDTDGDWWTPNEDGTYKRPGVRKASWAYLNEDHGPLTIYRPEGGAR